MTYAVLATVAPALLVLREYDVHMMTLAANNLNLTWVPSPHVC